MITTDRQPTLRALMPPLAQCLRYGRSASAPLGCAVGVHPDQPSTGAFSLVVDLGKELSPTGVVDRLGQHPAGQPLDVQVLYRNQVVGVDDLTGGPVVEGRTLIPHVSVDTLKFTDRLTSTVTPPLPAGDFALCSAKAGLGLAVVSGVGYFSPVAQNGKVSQAEIDANGLAGGGQGLGGGFNAEAYVPFPALPFQCQRLDLALQGPVELHLNLSHALNIEPPVVPQLTAVAIGRKGVAVVVPVGLEPREPRLLAGLHPTEERLECLIHSPEHVLAGGVVSKPKVARCSYLFQLVCLAVVVASGSLHLPSISAFLQSAVVQATGFRKLVFQGKRLCGVRVETVLEGSPHLSSLLVLDVPLDSGRRDVANGTDVVRTAPESGKPRAQHWKLLPQYPGGQSLELTGDMRWRPGGVRFDKNMHVVRHNLQSVNCGSHCSSRPLHKLFQPDGDISHQKRLAVLRAPHEVILERKYGSSIATVT